MKKLFITSLAGFALAVMFSANFQNNNLVQNSAFADGCRCVAEANSLCAYEGFVMYDAYLKCGGITSLQSLSATP